MVMTASVLCEFRWLAQLLLKYIDVNAFLAVIYGGRRLHPCALQTRFPTTVFEQCPVRVHGTDSYISCWSGRAAGLLAASGQLAVGLVRG